MFVIEDSVAAQLFATDLLACGRVNREQLRWLKAGMKAWREHGYAIEASPREPADEDCIDFPFFVHGRHSGDLQAAKQYLAWGMSLLNQLDAADRPMFQLPHDARRTIVE